MSQACALISYSVEVPFFMLSFDKMLIPRLNCVRNICYVTGLPLHLVFLLFCILIDRKIFNLSEINHANGDFVFFSQRRLYISFFFYNADSTCIACWLCSVYAVDCSLTLLWC